MLWQGTGLELEQLALEPAPTGTPAFVGITQTYYTIVPAIWKFLKQTEVSAWGHSPCHPHGRPRAGSCRQATTLP